MAERRAEPKKKAAAKKTDPQGRLDAMLMDADMVTLARAILYGVTEPDRLRAIIEKRGRG